MFITNPLTPAQLLAELLSLRHRSKADTVSFRPLRHNSDLCPAFQEKVDEMLDAYMRHRTDVQDIQGPRDGGVDVLLRYEFEVQFTALAYK
jgi:hypothetical protein